MLQNAIGDIHFVTDHQAIVTALKRGQRWCCVAKRAHADVWTQIWFYSNELRGDDQAPDIVVTATHTKAHRSLEAISKLAAAERHLARGNRRVDTFAKEGAGRDQAGIAPARRQTLARVKLWVTKSLEFIADLSCSVEMD